MYKLDLTDARLVLPVPVYELTDADNARRFMTGKHLDSENRRGRIAWFALDRATENTITICAGVSESGVSVLVAGPATRDGDELFYALPADMADPPETAVPLYEYVGQSQPSRLYSTHAKMDAAGYQRTQKPLCLVWPNPVQVRLP